MKKLLRDFRIYTLKKNIGLLIGLLAAIGADLGVWFALSANGDEATVKAIMTVRWLFIAVITICGFLFVYTIATKLISDPNKLKGHLENLPAGDREQLLDEYEKADAPENGRFFLSKFMLYFTFGGGIMRYSIIDRISIFPKGLWVESVSRSVLLKTASCEDKTELMNKLIERANKGRKQDE